MGRPTDDDSDFAMPLKFSLLEADLKSDEVRESKYIMHSKEFDYSFVIKEVIALDDEIGILTVEVTGFFEGPPTTNLDEFNAPLVHLV